MHRLTNRLAGYLQARHVLFAAAVVAGAGILAAYDDVQARAAHQLALRQGPPAAVAIQDFRPRRDTGLLGEVRILGEIDMDAAVTLPLRGATPPQQAEVVPLFPVSPAGAARLATQAGGEDGDGSVLAAQIARRAPGQAPRTALGFVVLPAVPGAAAPRLSDVAETVYGAGDNGMLVALNGTAGAPDPVALLAEGALAARGLDLAAGFVAVQPFLSGRTAALAAPAPSRLPYHLLALALALLATAGLLHLLPGRAGQVATAPAGAPEGPEDYTPPPPSSHPEFAPLPSQGEIHAADRVARNRRGKHARVVSRLRKSIQGVPDVRNPR